MKQQAIKAAYGERKKYIKVPVSERLPEKEGFYCTFRDDYGISITGFINGNWHLPKDHIPRVTEWLEEIPGHSEEMLSALSEIMRFKHELRLVMSDKLQYPDNFLKALNNAEELINKIEEYGK